MIFALLIYGEETTDGNSQSKLLNWLDFVYTGLGNSFLSHHIVTIFIVFGIGNVSDKWLLTIFTQNKKDGNWKSKSLYWLDIVRNVADNKLDFEITTACLISAVFCKLKYAFVIGGLNEFIWYHCSSQIFIQQVPLFGVEWGKNFETTNGDCYFWF